MDEDLSEHEAPAQVRFFKTQFNSPLVHSKGSISTQMDSPDKLRYTLSPSPNRPTLLSPDGRFNGRYSLQEEPGALQRATSPDKADDWESLFVEEGEFQLFDPSFGRPKQANAFEETEPTHVNIPNLQWCAYCSGDNSTEVKFEATSKTFFSSLGIFLAGGFLGCFLMPYYMDRCKKPVRLCAKCKHVL
jgi:hypothetical protein